MPEPLVGIVILNWNRIDLTKSCLDSVFQQKYKNYRVIVIDNGSSDGSVAWLQIQDNITLISNDHNLGFAQAINQGFETAIEKLGCNYAVSLNNDAELAKDWLGLMVRYMERNPDCGFAQGASMQLDNPNLYDSTGIYLEAGFIPNQRASGKTDPCLNVPVIGPNAAGSVYRAAMLKAVAHQPGVYFDNRFFAYVEDVDFNLRCTVRGYKFGYVPSAKLLHIGSATGNKIAKKKMFWGSRNLVWLVFKNVPLQILVKSYKKILRSHLASLQFLHREQPGNFSPYLFGLIVGVLGTPLFVLKRRQNLKKIVISNDKFLELLVPSNPPVTNPFKRVVNLLK